MRKFTTQSLPESAFCPISRFLDPVPLIALAPVIVSNVHVFLILSPCDAEKYRRLCVGILATLVGDCLQCVVRLLHNLIDCTEVLIFKQESQLFFVAWEL